MAPISRFLSLLPLLAAVHADVPYPDSRQLCSYSCEAALSSYIFLGSAPLPDVQRCANPLAIRSYYLCAKKYCSSSDWDDGVRFLQKTCDEFDKELPSFNQEVGNVSAAELNAVPMVKIGEKIKSLNHTILPDPTYFSRSLEANRARSLGRTYNIWFGYALYIFWAVVVFCGICTNVVSNLMRPSAHAVAPDVEGHGPSSRNKSSLLAVRSYATMPNTFRLGFFPAMPGLIPLTLVVYAILNGILCGVAYDKYYLGNSISYAATPGLQMVSLVGRRFASLALANLPVVFLFAARNNPFIYATGWSFDVFNRFHKWTARILVVEIIAHGIAFTRAEFIIGGAAVYKSKFLSSWFSCGVAAVVVLSFIVIASNKIVRQKAYDTFLAVHIVLIVTTLVLMWHHLNNTPNTFNGALWAAVGIWASERLIRFTRLIVAFALGQRGRADLRFDEDTGLLRIDATAMFASAKPQPGAHYFVYMPTTRLFWQSHPFTLVAYDSTSTQLNTPSSTSSSASPSLSDMTVEKVATRLGARETRAPSDPRSTIRYGFMITPQKGFTAHARVLASRFNGMVSKLVLLEGPYGVAPPVQRYSDITIVVGGSGISMGVSSAYAALRRSTNVRVRLVWAVRQAATLRSVVEEELACALSDERFVLEAYVTGDVPDQLKSDGKLFVKAHGRPDVAGIVSEAAARTNGAMIACGPKPMMEAVRLAAAAEQRAGNRRMDLFVESFSW